MRPGLLRVDGHAVWILLKKTKIPCDSTRWARKPLRPFSAYTLEPLFLHILKAAVSPVIAKPVQGSQLKFSYARNVSCYKLVIHHSRGDGTARPAPSVASTRTVRRSGEHRSGSCPSRSRLLRQERIGKGLCCKPKKSPSRSSVLDADKPFLPLGRNVFRHRALSVEKNKGTP